MPSSVSATHIIALLILLLPANQMFAQNRLLDQKINIEIRNLSLNDALSDIEYKGGFHFSYGQGIINRDSIVSISAVQISIRQIISRLCGPNVDMVESGNHIILKKHAQEQHELLGVIINSRTKNTIPNARIEGQNRNRLRSDRKGSFCVTCSEYPCFIAVSASGYQDTLINIPKHATHFVVEMQPKPIEHEVIFKAPIIQPGPFDDNNLDSLGFMEAFKIRPSNDSVIYNDLESRPFQASFLPFLGSNLWHSGNFKYSTSVNILSGYVGAVSGLEIGLAMNIVRRNMLGFQFAGLLNIVNGSVSGTQISPGINLVYNHVTGVQAAGLFNYCHNELNGMQMSLINNTLNGTGNGAQFSLVSNLSLDSLNGMQASGVISVSHGRYVGSQIATVLNISQAVNGKLQLSGIYNKAYEARGIQISAIGNSNKLGETMLQTAFIFNLANEIRLLQCPALYNRCRINHGLQLGLINISDSCRGAQIGFINISDDNSGFAVGFFTVVKNGYRAVEFSYSELNNINFCFKSGLSRFYNIINTGISPQFNNTRMYLGYGLGTALPLGRKWMYNCDLTASHVFEHNSFVKDLNLWLSLKPQIGINIARSFILFAGISLNLSASRLKNPYTNEFLTDMNPQYAYYTASNNQTQYSLWQGFNVGLRF